MKFISFYLPQFHEIPENNEWWGKGFTEWTNTKRAKALFKGHEQPKEPLNDNYYDLSNVDTLRWQTDLAKKYGVYGFCFYHYWFNGKKLLEKPAEILLEHQEIQFPFCLCWANHTWSRAWDGKNNDILIEQKYGDQAGQIEHFEYLMKFFSDERYIKINGKPVMVIYDASSIPECDSMLELWNQMAKGKGMAGIEFLEMLSSHNSGSSWTGFDGKIEFEPMYTIRHKIPFLRAAQRPMRRLINKAFQRIGLKKHLLNRIDYDYIWNNIINRIRKDADKTYLGAFIDWDNCARRGKDGLIVDGASAPKFKHYLHKQVALSKKEYIFINAWNEWAEGCYLEPDKINGYSYLEAIKEVTKL